jgi:choline dehydrogenase-like flavoprotein
MPVVPRGNTNAPVIAVAERAADLIRHGRALERPAESAAHAENGTVASANGVAPQHASA